MNATTDGIEPPFTNNTGKSHGGDAYIFVVGFFCIFVLLTSLTSSHICKRSRSPPPTVSFDNDADNHHLLTFSRGLDDDVLVTFPTFLYSEATMPHKCNIENLATNSVCSICLADYKPRHVVRLLPECNHLFHVKCIDTWLKVHPTCPMCRIELAACRDCATINSTSLTHS